MIAVSNIYEKSQPIAIVNSSITSMKGINFGEYSLKQNFFDPTKSSPPNEFMLKLQMRLNKYKKTCDYTMDDNLEIK